ncbi:hypothetical protein LCGC14_0895420, partial [marine sediment metagenome]
AGEDLGSFTAANLFGRLDIHRVAGSAAADSYEGLGIHMDASALVATSTIHGVIFDTTGSTSGEVIGIGILPGVEVLIQHTGTFLTPDQGPGAGTYAGRLVDPDGTPAFTEGVDAQTIMVTDDDEIYIGSVGTFTELEVILTTPASKTIGQPPNNEGEYYFRSTGDVWVPFFLTDGTDGFTLDGIISFDSTDLTAWKSNYDPFGANSATGYWIKIRRTRNGSITSPVPTTVKILNPTNFSWDENGNIVVEGISATTYETTVTAAELAYVGDVTSLIQAQIDGKEGTLTNSAGLAAALSDERGTGTVNLATVSWSDCTAIQEFGSGDATPDVSGAETKINNCFFTNANGLITNFDDGTTDCGGDTTPNHSCFVNGQSGFWLRVDDASSQFDCSGNANMECNANVDYTGSPTQITYWHWWYEDSRWNSTNHQVGMSDPTTLAVSSAAHGTPRFAHFTDADDIYSDNTTPHVLVAGETKLSILTNYGATQDRVYTMHAYDNRTEFCMQVGAAFQMDLEPPSGALITLNGTDAATDEHIINAADTQWDIMCCWTVEVSDGVFKMACKSDNANWAEATPP